MYTETIGHDGTTYRIEVQPSGIATVTHEKDGRPIAWGVPAGKALERDDVAVELSTRINRCVEEGREVIGVR